MDIKFYIPKYETIPTGLRLYVDGTYVRYEHLPGEFGYDFIFGSDMTLEHAMDITKKLANIMCSQSYDHGSQWRITSIEEVEQEGHYKIGHIIRVKFRIRDSY